jgi:hypothetical protein
VTDLYRLSVDQYHRMITPGILLDGDPVELLEGLLLQKWASRTSDGIGSMYVDEFYPLTVQQYHEMARLGILTTDDRVELLEGVLIQKMTKNDPHIEAARRCRRAIEPRLPSGRFYETEQPVVLAQSEPEPDGVVIIGSPFDPRLIKPHPSDIELIVEVSDWSLSIDRGLKLRSCARAGIVCYWIVNLIDRQIEVYTQPDATAEMPTYAAPQIFKPGDSVPLNIAGQLISHIAVFDILPSV